MKKYNGLCYLLIGLPGSGKSKIAEDILKTDPQMVYISSDQYIEKIAQEQNITYELAYQDNIDLAQKWVNQQVQIAIKERRNIIWDQTNIILSARKRKISTLMQGKYEVIALSLELSSEELYFRNNKRIKEGGKKISKRIINKMMIDYVRPTYEEGFSEIYLINNASELNRLTNNATIPKIKI